MRFSTLGSIDTELADVIGVYVNGSYASGLASASSDLDLLLVSSCKIEERRPLTASVLSALLTGVDERINLRDPEVEWDRVSVAGFARRQKKALDVSNLAATERYEDIVEYFEWSSLRPIYLQEGADELADLDRNRVRRPDDFNSVIASASLCYAEAQLREAGRSIRADDSSAAAHAQNLAAGAAVSAWLAERGAANPKVKWRHTQLERLRSRGCQAGLALRLLAESEAEPVSSRSILLHRQDIIQELIAGAMNSA